MDAFPLFPAFVIIILVSMVVVIGAQFFLILKEFKNSVTKINKILDDTGLISESVSKPINMVSTILMGIKGGATIMKLFGQKKTESQKDS